ncbi:MAG: response regulator, partial [Verrucomicrobiota bacterium]|nr:response regulator [Verrucomicrobiota bacterium]
IVDDTETNRRILCTLTKKWSLIPREADSGKAALALIDAGEKFDLAILDMQMPDMDGAMLAREIRRREACKNLPLVLLSSIVARMRLPDEDIFAACLTKPAKASQIFDAIVGLFPSEAALPAPPIPLVAVASSEPLPPVTPKLERLLLAEDNIVNQKVALHMLARLGYRADVVANGLEAIEAVHRQRYDIILMDVQMPEMDGLEATRKLIEQLPSRAERPWIIALTANVMHGDREICLDAGMDDYIPKPLTMPALTSALERARPGALAST